MLYDREAMLSRIMAKVAIDRETGCWLWTGAINSKGYGNIGLCRRDFRKTYQAHRLCFILHRGEIEPGLQLDHLCRRPRCVNPDHLEPVTASVNAIRGFAHITHCPNGHEYTESNTYMKRSQRGMGRACKQCNRNRAAAWRVARSDV